MNNDILIIGFVWPEPNSTAAGSRMLQLIDVFQNEKYKITFISSASKSEKSFNLEELNIKTYVIKLNDSGFDTLIKQINPSIVLFDRFLTEEQFGWRIAENCQNAIRILDTEDLHFLRHARHQAFKEKNNDETKYLVNDLTKREIASIYRCDLTLIISKYEYDLLSNTFKMDKNILLYLPFMLNKVDPNIINSYPAFNERKHFMTIGNFKHEPNWNTVIYLKNTIWPLIRKKLPIAKLFIYGAYATEKVNQLQNDREGFIIKGWAKNTKDVFLNHRICLAPLQFGAGLKGKLVDAMLYGTPSVTTEVGAEAMHDDLPWNGFITDDPKKIAQNSIDLYQNEKLWLKAQRNGLSIINFCYSKVKFSKILMDAIIKIENNLEQHRVKNFIGSLLQYHTLKSTKYMSKWIEEKNTKAK